MAEPYHAPEPIAFPTPPLEPPADGAVTADPAEAPEPLVPKIIREADPRAHLVSGRPLRVDAGGRLPTSDSHG